MSPSNGFQHIFKRYEKKYVVTSSQRQALLSACAQYIVPDKYGESTLYNIYFDTPDYRLIRQSIEKPVYKEKLRIRTYGKPDEQSNAFLELKKKYKGVVYKRRINMRYGDCIKYAVRREYPENADSQILREIDYFFSFYPNIRPAVCLFYDRCAYYGRDDRELRLTFDSAVRFRTTDFDLAKGDFGTVLLDKDLSVLEIKCIGAMPLWLTDALDRLKIYPASYSKYAEAYKTFAANKDFSGVYK
ncbi:MAG: polyphosphate polymerase domain-containing protein [Acutalibacteraceae bacterium]